MNEELITITKKEYDNLKSNSDFLYYLESMGVDNWEGYSEAWGLYRKEHPEE